MYSPNEMAYSGFVRIRRIWEVKADPSYQVAWGKGYPHQGSILLRTLAGEGYVTLKKGNRLVCGPETLINLRPEKIKGYGCIKPPWSFWWIECESPETVCFPFETVMPIRQIANEPHTLLQNAGLLGADRQSDFNSAAAFLNLVHLWHREWRLEKRHEHPNRSKIRNVQSLMEASIEKPLHVSFLARKICLSECRFRQLFKKVTGISPKAYYENLRLGRAATLLRDTDMKISDIASQLNYSSAFHLSRAFKKHYGIPPSGYRPELTRFSTQ